MVRDLEKRFDQRVAYTGITFEVARGEVFGFLGPNGAGKTTTVRTLGTLIAPSSGKGWVAGLELKAENGPEIRRRISIMPESPGLYLKLSVGDNLRCFADLFEIEEPAKRIAWALEMTKVAERINDPAGSLSKGLKQRVALARALLNQPQVLFLDEPTSGLDPAAARDVHDLIEGLRAQGVTIFLTTHRLAEAEKLCDRVAILNTSMQRIGKPSELRDQMFAKTLKVVTLAPLADPQGVFSSVTGIESWRPVDDATYLVEPVDVRSTAPGLTRALVAAGADVVSIAPSEHTLEDVYMELVAGEQGEAGR